MKIFNSSNIPEFLNIPNNTENNTDSIKTIKSKNRRRKRNRKNGNTTTNDNSNETNENSNTTKSVTEESSS